MTDGLERFDPLAAQASNETDNETTIARLAALSIGDYERCRQEEATALHWRVSTLDKVVARARGDDLTDEKTGRPLKMPDTEPWPESVDGAVMLTELSAAIRRYVVLSLADADFVALWAAHTHALDAFHHTPRLFITSPDKRCGKTRLLKVVAKIVARPLNAGNISSASFFRIVQATHATLLVDEFDAHRKDDEEMRGVINNGYERDNPVIRCDPNTLEPLAFDTYAACAIASIGSVWPTVEDRSIAVRLQRKRPSEKVARFRRNEAPELDRLASMAARWAADHGAALLSSDPRTPDALSDRAADIWAPLLAIADIAGGDWPTRSRHAAVSLSAEGKADDQSIGTMLLADLREFIAKHPEDAFPTRLLIDHLATLEERPWPAYGKARKAISAKQVADILRPFDVRSNTVRIGGETPKGYRRLDIERATSRYLVDPAATPPHPAENSQKPPESPATNDADVAVGKQPKLSESAACGGVVDETRPPPDWDDIDVEREAIVVEGRGQL